MEEWVLSYLEGRTTRTIVQTKESKETQMDSNGVPQGPFLSLTFYAIYANNLPANRENANPITYVDDHSDCVTAKKSEELRDKLQAEADKTMKWMTNNIMCLPPIKQN